MTKIYLYGKNPLLECISVCKEKNDYNIFENIFLTKDSLNDNNIMSHLQSSKLTYSVVTRGEIDSMVGKEVNHQGICASLVEKHLYSNFEDILKMTKNKERATFILLDELEDPHNVGAIIRSAKAFNVDAVLLPEFNQAQINGTVIKTASGANFSIPVVRVGNINTTIKKLKDVGFWVYGLTGKGDNDLSKTKFDSSSLIIIGAEGSGIKEKTLENCDFKLSININPGCESLNASVAAAVTLYEINKQKIALTK